MAVLGTLVVQARPESARPALSGPGPALVWFDYKGGAMELTTVADDEAVVHDGPRCAVYDGLEPDTVHDLRRVRLPDAAPPRASDSATFATVNDVHFGETECGLMDGLDDGARVRPCPAAEPYPEMMNRGGHRRDRAIAPDAVVVKGDLTSAGTAEEYRGFLDVYGEAFGDRLVHVRGNHESYHGGDLAAVPDAAGRPARA